MTVPVVSVVMGVYNGSSRLENTLKSVLNQKGCSFEFIVVDDGSTDNSGCVLDEWSEKYSRLRVFHQENRGLTQALIRGCEEAKGKYIARQDLGDISLPNRLIEQARALDKYEELAFVSCCTRFAGPESEFLFEKCGNSVVLKPTNIIDIKRRHGVIAGPAHHGSVMFRKTRYIEAGGYRKQFYYGQDWDLWYRLGLLGKFMMLPNILYEAGIEVGDISAINKNIQEEFAKLSLKSLKLRLAGKSDETVLREADVLREKRNGKINITIIKSKGHYFIGECLRRNGNNAAAHQYFLSELENNPINVKAWVRLCQTIIARKSKA